MIALHTEFTGDKKTDAESVWFSTVEQMLELMAAGSKVICERSIRDIPEHFEVLANSINIIISSKLTHCANISERITNAVFSDECAEVRDVFQTMLHEVVMNALIHGNLGMSSNYDDFDAVNNYIDAITARLANDKIASMPLMISIEKNQTAIYFSVTQTMGIVPRKLESGWDVADGRGFGLKIIESMSSDVLVYPNQKTLTVKILRK